MKLKESFKQIDYALVAHTHISMYLMHKYWARKPYNVVSAYIERYSKVGEVVLDPFSGSGITPCEALKLKRKAIAVDIDPLAIFITHCTAMPIDIDMFSKEFEKLKSKLKPKIEALYESRCNLCNERVVGEAFIWKNSRPVEFRYSCRCRKGTLWKNFNKFDEDLLHKIDTQLIPCWYPKNELIWNTRINVHRGTKVYELFTRRNLLSLAMILSAIEEDIKDESLREMFKFTFSSSLPQASKLVFVIRRRGRSKGDVEESTPEVGSWATRGYWVPPEFFEINAWNCFEERFKKIRRGKEESNRVIPKYQEAKNYEQLQANANIFLLNKSTLDLSNLPADSVDYVFTDPPYGDSVPYLELDYMWNSWLRFNPDFEEEIIISDSPIRKKTFDIYEKMLSAAFKEVFMVLKSGRWLTVTFHNNDIKIWNAIINSVVLAGFDLEKIIYQPPARTSPKGLLAPYGSAVGDYYMRFRKPETGKPKSPIDLDEERYKRIVINATKKILAERGEPTPYQHILNGIIPELNKNGVLLKGTKDIEEVLRGQVDKDLVLSDVIGEDGKKKGEMWWFKDPSSIKINLVPLGERVEKAIINVLNRKIKASFDDILQEIFIAFPNALTPDTQSIKSILESYAKKKGAKGFWWLKPSVARRQKEHSQMIFYLAQIGKTLGYRIWIGSKEQADLYGSHRLSEFSEKRLKLSSNVHGEAINRIKEIDVLWLENSVIKAGFEVENTTTITEAIVRSCNIPYDVYRFIIIPEERENLIYNKIKEPGLIELGIEAWKFIYYKDLEFFVEEFKRRKFSFNEFLNLAKEPRARTQYESIKLFGDNI
jgi:16S rRNA G966 N2-methylase RsmD